MQVKLGKYTGKQGRKKSLRRNRHSFCRFFFRNGRSHSNCDRSEPGWRVGNKKQSVIVIIIIITTDATTDEVILGSGRNGFSCRCSGCH